MGATRRDKEDLSCLKNAIHRGSEAHQGVDIFVPFLTQVDLKTRIRRARIGRGEIRDILRAIKPPPLGSFEQGHHKMAPERVNMEFRKGTLRGNKEGRPPLTVEATFRCPLKEVVRKVHRDRKLFGEIGTVSWQGIVK